MYKSHKLQKVFKKSEDKAKVCFSPVLHRSHFLSLSHTHHVRACDTIRPVWFVLTALPADMSGLFCRPLFAPSIHLSIHLSCLPSFPHFPQEGSRLFVLSLLQTLPLYGLIALLFLFPSSISHCSLHFTWYLHIQMSLAFFLLSSPCSPFLFFLLQICMAAFPPSAVLLHVHVSACA